MPPSTVNCIRAQTKCTLHAMQVLQKKSHFCVCTCVCACLSVCQSSISEPEALWPWAGESRLTGSGQEGARGSMRQKYQQSIYSMFTVNPLLCAACSQSLFKLPIQLTAPHNLIANLSLQFAHACVNMTERLSKAKLLLQ